MDTWGAKLVSEELKNKIEEAKWMIDGWNQKKTFLVNWVKLTEIEANYKEYI